MVKKGSIISIKGISFDLLFFFHYFVTKRLNANIMTGKSRQEEILHLDERTISSQARTFFMVKYTKQEYSEEEMKVLSSIHSFGFYSIVYIIKGTGKCRIDNDVLDLADNSILHIPPHSIVDSRKIHVDEGIMLLFSEDLFSSCNEGFALNVKNILYASYHKNSIHKLSNEVGARCLTYLNALSNEEQGDRPFTNEMALSLITQIIITTARASDIKPIPLNTNSSLCLRFADLINAHFQKEHNANYYAALLGVDTKTLSKHCQLMFHTSPHEVIKRRILFEAKKTLLHSVMEIKSIGYYLGFSDYTSFHKFFKRETGMSPLEYRNMSTESSK